MNTAEALADIDRVITSNPGGQASGYAANIMTQSTLIMACIKRNAPPGSEYRIQGEALIAVPIDQAGGRRRFQGGASLDQMLRGVLHALRFDIEAGKLATFEEMIRADIYADLVTQGEALHAERHHRAGAVLVGAALEEHVRKLATKFGITLVMDSGKPKAASLLNADLKKASAYSEAQKATVEGWQKVRNDAAHCVLGFEGADTSMVPLITPMIIGVRAFIAQYPA